MQRSYLYLVNAGLPKLPSFDLANTQDTPLAEDADASLH